MSVRIDQQADYWDRVGPSKAFAHPVNLERLRELLAPTASIVEYGCGYGRVLKCLFDDGYRSLAGFDIAPAMIEQARKRVPGAQLDIVEGPQLPLPDASADAVLLFAVLTCVPTDSGQRAIVREIERVLRPNGLLYISDLWLQPDDRNRVRYELGVSKFGTYGVFELSEGVVLRHHHRDWIADLTKNFFPVVSDDLVVDTMNGHLAQGFQWFGRRRVAV